MRQPDQVRWSALLLASGAASLAYETVWIRRLSLWLGGSAVSTAVVVGAFMGGWALGGLAAHRWPGRGRVTYARLELAAAVWAVVFPVGSDLLAGAHLPTALGRDLAATALLLPPAVCLGATWPVLARVTDGRSATALYAANTSGAVLGVLGCTFLALPTFGIRATELLAAGLGATVGLVALVSPDPEPEEGPGVDRPATASLRSGLLAVAAAGFVCTGLEVWWTRLAAVALGATVQTLGLVLATFLAMLALGTALGRSFPTRPERGVGPALGALGALALLGAFSWGRLPYWAAAAYRWGGADGQSLATPTLALVAMGGAPIASGWCFSLVARAAGRELGSRSGALYAANTSASALGAAAAGLWLVPWLEARGAVVLLALIAAVAAVAASRSMLPGIPTLLLAPMLPEWDARLYAVGVHLRISDFADPSEEAVRTFVDEGWDLVSYDQGTTGAVAVGRSRRTGNTWLSINGKVDASTGDDMPTQVLSGEIPTTLSADPRRVLVVGLASGVTAGAVLRDARVRELVVVELEPAVVAAEPAFRPINGSPTLDPRTTLVVDDARAWLGRGDERFDVIVSEPSNPWITGVSSLFTLEYWQLLRERVGPDGVVCQWIQLYGMGTDELRGLIRTFRTVFPDAVLFETIPGADVLLVSGPVATRGDRLPVPWLLDADELRAVSGSGWLNTDDHPVVEWRAPKWLHRDTSTDNAALLHGAD